MNKDRVLDVAYSYYVLDVFDSHPSIDLKELCHEISSDSKEDGRGWRRLTRIANGAKLFKMHKP